METGNDYLQGFKERHNAKFAKAPAKPDNLHRALNIEPDRLADVLCLDAAARGSTTVSKNQVISAGSPYRTRSSTITGGITYSI